MTFHERFSGRIDPMDGSAVLTEPVYKQIQNEAFNHNGVPVREMLGFPLKLAAQLLGKDYKWVYRRVRRGELRMSPGKLISRAELERFLAQDYFEERVKQ